MLSMLLNKTVSPSIFHNSSQAKKEELLLHAQGAIAGLKINADIMRYEDLLSFYHVRTLSMFICKFIDKKGSYSISSGVYLCQSVSSTSI